MGLFIQNLWVPGDPLVLALVRRRAPGRRLGGRRLSAAAPRGVRGGRPLYRRSDGKVPGHRGRSRQNMENDPKNM